jgi:asparagine N-glycosylation enzyme membrane subunit Stt3
VTLVADTRECSAEQARPADTDLASAVSMDLDSEEVAHDPVHEAAAGITPIEARRDEQAGSDRDETAEQRRGRRLGSILLSPAAVYHRRGPISVERLTTRWNLSRPLDFDRIVLAAALISGSLLRFVDLGGVGLNSDEAVYAGQAASLAGNPHFTGLFPVIRAHPLVFQVLISPFYGSGTPDVAGRYVSALFGVGTIILVYLLGRTLYGRRAGVIAAVLLAVMPYHVVVSRQILLDGPMTFFATAALLCIALFVRSDDRAWLILAGASIGVAALTKETAIILVGSVFVFLSLTSSFWRPLRHVIGAGALAVGLALTYPLVTVLSGGSRNGQSYLTWQLTRQPNHSITFYLTEVPVAIGVLALVAAVLAVILRRRDEAWREVLLVAWVAVPFVFFEVWPVKGFPYLLVTTPAIALLAASVLSRLLRGQPERWRRAAGASAVAICVMSMLVPAIGGVVDPASSGLAGAGGIPGGRQAGQWIAAHVPSGSQLMTIGPSMANILEYYSGHRSDGLSVSPNPAHRNPSYAAIPNPSNALRTGIYQYVVWDAYSAQRSPTFAAKVLALVRRYDGRVVHTELASFKGKPAQPVIVIYQVAP